MPSGLSTAGLAAQLAALAVAGRTAVLRLLSPVESLVRKFDRRRRASMIPVPPLWLRRHAGPIRAFRTSGDQALALLDHLGLLRPEARILDFGCGPGSLVPGLARVLGPDGRYLGLDVHTPSVEWCQRTFAADSRLAFESLDPRGGRPWPVAGSSRDLILAKSVFTHLLEAEAREALSEIRRVLSPGGRAVITAFLFDGAPFANRTLPWFPWPGPDASVRWRRASRPTAAVAVEAGTFRRWVAAAGLRIESMLTGFHPGGAAPPTGQDTLILAAVESPK